MKYFATVVLVAIFAVASTQSLSILPEKEKNNLSPIAAEENIQSIVQEKRSLEAENEKINVASGAEEKLTESVERNKRGLLYNAAYTAPVAYSAYTSPYAYARSYAYPYVASPYVASLYRSYPYVYNSPFYF